MTMERKSLRALGHVGALALGMILPLAAPAADTDDIPALQAKAKSGDSDAQYELGVAYQNGDNVKQSDTEGVFWIRKAADQGDTDAMLNMGIAYRGGFGVAQDYKQAYMWLELAAKHDNQKALELRKDIAPLMSLQDIEEAEKMAANWQPTVPATSAP